MVDGLSRKVYPEYLDTKMELQQLEELLSQPVSLILNI